MKRLIKLLKEEGWSREAIQEAVNTPVPYHRFLLNDEKDIPPWVLSCLYYKKDEVK